MIFPALGRLYGKIINSRNSLYRKGFFKSYSLGAKTVSIGNITVGGTGKTPMVAFIAETLAAKGEKVCILSRGYGRENPKSRVLVSDGTGILTDSRSAGDEPFELACELHERAIIISDADRVAAADWARENFKVTAFVLDDAFQHQRAKRDLNIVLLDATNPFGNYRMLPSGILREPIENLKRADLIIITRTNLVSEEKILSLKSEISSYSFLCPIFTSENKVSELVEINKYSKAEMRKPNFETQCSEPAQRSAPNEEQLTAFKKNKALAFCALGNPNNFFDQLRREDFNLTAVKTYPDHYFYTRKDIEKLHLEAGKVGAEIFLTTAKDAVKLADLQFQLPCFAVRNKLFFDDREKLIKMIENL